MRVPFFDLKLQYLGIRDEILAAVDRVCGSASFILGAEVAEFEKEFASYCGVRHCVAVNSGTSALHLALLAAGVKPEDEVITTANTFIATAEAISYTGATPVFVDIDPATANIDPELVERSLTRRTKAIVPVHLYGRPADLESILRIGESRGIHVIEDACQALGARIRGKRVGGWGCAAAFSFYPSKNLGAYGEGGALTTNDERVAELARRLRDHGQERHYFHDHVGYNYRMDGLQGAVLRVKLKHLHAWMKRRLEIVRLYQERLPGIRIGLPCDDPLNESVYHLFVTYVDNRDAVRRTLEAHGVETAVHYQRPVHLQKAYAQLGYQRGDLPNTESACDRALSMPLFPEMTSEQAEHTMRSLAVAVGDG